MAISGTDLLEVPTISKAYVSGLNFRESPHNSYGQTYGTNVPPFQDPEIPIEYLDGIIHPFCLEFPAGAAQIRQKVGKNGGAWGIWGHTSGWKKSGL